jgi:WD40 repeat protein
MEKVAISPDNLMFYGAAGDDFIWDSGSGDLIRKLPKTLTFAAFVPDSKRIYVTTADKLDKKKVVVKVWDLYTHSVVRTLTTADADETRPSPDGKYLLTRASKKISIWDARTGKLVIAIPDEGYENVEPSTVGLIAVSKGALVKVFDMNTGAELHRFLTETLSNPGSTNLGKAIFQSELCGLQTAAERLWFMGVLVSKSTIYARGKWFVIYRRRLAS